jgi:hypothetical protein
MADTFGVEVRHAGQRYGANKHVPEGHVVLILDDGHTTATITQTPTQMLTTLEHIRTDILTKRR